MLVRRSDDGLSAMQASPAGLQEADLVICKSSRPVLMLHERKARVTLMSRLAGKTAAETIAAMTTAFRRLDPRMRGSVTTRLSETDIVTVTGMPVSLNLTQRRARSLGRACPRLDLSRHDPVRRKGEHLANEITISLLFNQLKQCHPLICHRHLRLWFRESQPKPLPKIDGGPQRHHRPRAALRRGLRARLLQGTQPPDFDDALFFA